ncbi:MAG TPA: integrase arm-type DNA-binding domain-containing protein, partial [Candidatus Tectomicrobia bacterium]
MPHAHFTARWVAAAPAPPEGQVDYFDQTPPSLGLRVAPSGRKTWFVMYCASGRLRRYTLGTYPAVSLADARQRATDARHRVAHGGDPAQARQDGRQAPTVAELGAQYLDLYAKVQKKSWREDARYLTTEVLPAWGQRKAAEVRRRDVVILLDQIAARGAPIAANRVLSLVRKLWNWAISHDYLEHNPCLQVQPPGKEHSRERVLSAEEIRLVWGACTALPPVWEVYMKVVLLTAQRCGEVRTMQWSDVDLGAAWWTIPGTQAKNGLTHRVPLNAPVLALLHQLRREDRPTPWVFPSSRLQQRPITNISKTARLVADKAGVCYVTHDLRRTAASHMTSMGISRL